MPFESLASLPDNIKKLSDHKQKQWRGAWNGRFTDCKADGGSESDCESSAFAVANAAIKEIDDKAAHLDDDDDKKKPSRKKPKDKMATMPDADKAAIASKFFGGMQLTQEETEYTSTGGGQERACANCRWWLAYRDYDQCAIVEDWPLPITPNGLSNRWEVIPVYKPSPMEVIIVGESEVTEKQAEAFTFVKVPSGMKDRAVAYLKGLKDRVTPTPKGNPSMFFTKDANGHMRWFAITSNNYRDSDNPPEIFEEKAHKEFVNYLDNGGKMPELWYWHEPGLKWGQSDWVDYVDGFLMFGGTIDPGFEHVAEKVAADPNLGISHGYGYTYSDQKNGIIGWYRTFEISPLPMSKAANKWTGIALIQKEVAMEFSAEKRPDAVAKYGEDFIKEMEGQRDDQAKTVENLKIESKEGDNPSADEGTPEEKAAAEASDAIAMKMAGTAADLILSSKAFADLGTKVDGVTTDMAAVKERLDLLEKSDDEKVAAILSGKGRKLGQRASESGENTVDPNDPVVKETAPKISTLDVVTKEMVEGIGLENQPVA